MSQPLENRSFYGHKFVWQNGDNDSYAKIIYCYFKANTLIEKIKDYEEINKKQIINNFDAVLKFFYENIFEERSIDYNSCPGTTKEFFSFPKETLNDVLENFKAYEIN